MKFSAIAKLLGFTGAEFETQDGAVAFSVEQTTIIDAKLASHAVKKDEWKAEKEKMEADHKIALEAEQKKTTEANAALGKMTTELAEANEKIRVLEDEPADKKEIQNHGGGGNGDGDDKYSYSNERYKNVGKKTK